MKATPPLNAAQSHTAGVDRWNCPDCGSPLVAQFDYLPNQSYVPLGILDQVANLPPEIHCHTDAQLPWLQIHDDLPRQRDSARVQLSQATP